MTNEELIAALEAAPTGTRELGVAVLKAVGARIDVWSARWFIRPEGDAIIFLIAEFDEARVVTDLNFRLPGVPDGDWIIDLERGAAVRADLWVPAPNKSGRPVRRVFFGVAHTEALARIIVQLKAVLGMKGEKA